MRKKDDRESAKKTGYSRKRKEKEGKRARKKDRNRFALPPLPPQKETNFGLCACTQTKMKHNYVQFAKNVENLFFSHFYPSWRKWVQQREIV